MENHHAIHGKIHYNYMVIFHSYVTVITRPIGSMVLVYMLTLGVY